jgi:virginiamycin B lyase
MRAIKRHRLVPSVERLEARELLSTFQAFDLPPHIFANSLAAGQASDVWFNELMTNGIGRMDTSGKITDFPGVGEANRLVVGQDGAIWFAVSDANRLARLGGDGSVKYFDPQTPIAAIKDAPSTPKWYLPFTFGGLVGVNSDNSITVFNMPSGASASQSGGLPLVNLDNVSDVSIITGSDGAIWYTDQSAIVRLGTDGSVQEFGLLSKGTVSASLVLGADGNAWFIEKSPPLASAKAPSDRIGRITPSGVMADFGVATSNAGITALVSGPDGNLWFSEMHGNQLGRITPDGAVTEFALPIDLSVPFTLVVTPTRDIWFASIAAAGNGHGVLVDVTMDSLPAIGPERAGLPRCPAASLNYSLT